MCREIAGWLYSDGLPVLAMSEIAKHMLGRVIDHALYCGHPVQTNYLFDTGCAELAKQVSLPDYTNGYLGDVQYFVGYAIGSCIDTSVTNERFEQALKFLADRLRAIREASTS